MTIGAILWRSYTLKQLQQLQNTQVILHVFNVELSREIRERQQIEQKLRQSEARLAEAQRIARIGSWDFDLNTEKIIWSKELFTIFGLDPTQPEPTYPELIERIHPEDRAQWQRKVEQAVTTGEPYRVEHRVIFPDGSIHYIEGRGAAEVNGQGRVVRLFGTAMDITDRRRTEDALRESEERFRAVFEQAAVGICVDTLDGEALQMNQKFCDITGYSVEEIRAVHWSEITHPDDRAADWEGMHQLLAGKVQCFSIEKRYFRPDRSLIWVHLTVSLIHHATESPPNVLVIIQDISESKQLEIAQQQAELALQQLNQELESRVQARTAALQESEARFRQLAENISEVFWLLDPQPMQMLYVSPAYEQIWGKSVESLYASSLSWVESIHPDDRQQVLQALPHRTRSDWDQEYRIIQPNGAVRWIRDRAFPIVDKTGQIKRVAGLAEDITAQKQAEQEIQTLNESLSQQNQNLETLVEQRTAELLSRTRQLEATNRELESFSYSVSHDLRAPSRHIHGFVNVLRQHLERQFTVPDSTTVTPAGLDAKVSHYLDVIEASSRKMGLLIDGLLTLSRVGRRQIQSHPVALSTLVNEAIELAKVDSETTQAIEFRVGELPTVTGDAVLLQQVLVNLIHNAIKFSRNNAAPSIEIGSLPDQTVFVRDNGIGFAMNDAEHIFDAFQRLHGREFEGTGIGLAIVQRIIHRHQGNVWTEAQPNQGATFYFQLGRAHS